MDELGWYLGTSFTIESYRISLSAGLYNPYGLSVPKGFGRKWLKQINELHVVHTEYVLQKCRSYYNDVL